MIREQETLTGQNNVKDVGPGGRDSVVEVNLNFSPSRPARVTQTSSTGSVYIIISDLKTLVRILRTHGK